MSQVKKDILNGWKEIGGYVGRDIRTVERWEKQRGLPVRRVPGAGRATVYALIPELDDWLKSSKPDPAELAGSRPDPEVERLADLSASAGRSRLEVTPAAAEMRPASAEAVGVADGRWAIAWMTIAAAAILVLVVAPPVVRSHTKIAAAPARLNWSSGERSSAMSSRSQISGVDDLYLRGIYAFEQRTPESLERSEEDFRSAIAKDPDYAPAYAALANTYNLLREYSVMPEPEAYGKAKAAAEHAIALDPKLPEAHASLGFIDFFWLWDTARAEREFRTALTLDPSSALAHHWYGSMLTHEGRYDEAIEQLNIAERLAPTSAAILSTRALALGLSGHRVEAVDALHDVISESPGASSPHAILATLSKVEPRDSARFIDEMRRVAELRHSDEMLRVTAAAEPALRSRGENGMWTAILATEEQLHPGASDRTFLMVVAEAELARYDDAFADLTQLVRRHDPTALGVIVEPALAPMRRDRRYGELVASMGLPPLSR